MPTVTGTAAFCLQKPARNPRGAHKAPCARTLPIPITRPRTRIASRNWGCVSSSRRKRPFPSEETGHAKTSVRTAQLSFSAGAGVPGDTQPPAPATKGRRLRAGRLRGGDASPRGRTAAGLPLPPGPTRRPQLRRFPLPPALRGGGAGRAARLAAGSGPGPGGGGGGGGREEEGPGALRGSHVCPLGGRPRPPAGKPPPDAGGKRLLPAPSRRRKGGHGPSCHLQPRGQGTEPCGTDGQQRIPSGFLEEAARNARSQSGRGGGGTASAEWGILRSVQ